jgi:sensor histidine kinase YesM
MHPILADRKAFALYLIVLLALGLMMAAMVATAGNTGWAVAVAFSIPMFLVYGLVSLSSWYICRSLPLKSTNIGRIVVVLLLSSLVTSSLWALAGSAWTSVLSTFEFASVVTERYSSLVPFVLGGGIGLYLLSIAIHYLLITFEDSKNADRRSLELKMLAQSAELKALRSQVDPHFLFNSLNSISALTTKDPPAARSMLLLLSDFLRQTLRLGQTETITLREEISLCGNFLDIEQVRFGSRLKVAVKVSEESATCMVPPLLLQPLVENAVGHGIAHLLSGGTIEISAEIRGGRLYIRIQNPVDSDRAHSRGTRLGIANVRKRLQTLYNAEARLDISEHDDLFAVEIVLPAHSS